MAELTRIAEVVKKDIQDMRETELMYGGVFPRGHLINIAGEPGTGKTTILERVAGDIAAEGMDVYYLQMDSAAGDIPEAKRRADEGGYKLLAPDIKVGVSLEQVIALLEALADSNEDLSNVVLIVDTLKKIAEVINKSSATKIYKLLRRLTGRGCTVITLSHCNKYRDTEGIPVIEGTGDIRSDFDEVALLFSHPGDFGTLTTSLYWPGMGVSWTKSRAPVQPCSWSIDLPGREVQRLPKWVDTLKLSLEKRETKKVEDLTQCISLILSAGADGINQTLIETLARDQIGASRKAVLRALEVGLGKIWTRTRGNKNSWMYSLVPESRQEMNSWN